MCYGIIILLRRKQCRIIVRIFQYYSRLIITYRTGKIKKKTDNQDILHDNC